MRGVRGPSINMKFKKMIVTYLTSVIYVRIYVKHSVF